MTSTHTAERYRKDGLERESVLWKSTYRPFIPIKRKKEGEKSTAIN